MVQGDPRYWLCGRAREARRGGTANVGTQFPVADIRALTSCQGRGMDLQRRPSCARMYDGNWVRDGAVFGCGRLTVASGVMVVTKSSLRTAVCPAACTYFRAPSYQSTESSGFAVESRRVHVHILGPLTPDGADQNQEPRTP